MIGLRAVLVAGTGLLAIAALPPPAALAAALLAPVPLALVELALWHGQARTGAPR